MKEAGMVWAVFSIDRSIWLGTRGSLQPTASEEQNPLVQQAGETESCQQHHERAWKGTHPQLSLEVTAALANILILDCKKPWARGPR